MPTAPSTIRVRAPTTALACCWRRLTVQEMNYGAQRVVEVQAPWTADKQWHRR
jgi:hypothetical protein